MTGKRSIEYRQFHSEYAPLSVLDFHGCLGVVEHGGYRLLLDRAGRLKWAVALKDGLWPGINAAVRRTIGNKWLVYESLDYAGTKELTGCYYIPRLVTAREATGELATLLKVLDEAAMIHEIANSSELAAAGRKLVFILQGTIPVLPPETLWVDYDVIPLMISKGCPHNCTFCTVKTGGDPEPLSLERISIQAEAVTRLLGQDLENYGSVFLGQNDALSAGIEPFFHAAMEAAKFLSGPKAVSGRRLFAFASPGSIMENADRLSRLDTLPYDEIRLNVGLESLDQETLEALGKPLSAHDVEQAAHRALEGVSSCNRVKVSFNFVLSERLPIGHMEGLRRFIRSLGREDGRFCSIFISPLCTTDLATRFRDSETRRTILELKASSRVPLYLYLMVPLT